MDLQMGHATTVSPNVNIEETLEEKVQDAAAQKCWYVTETLVKEHGRTMGCPPTTQNAVDESQESCCNKAA